MGDTTGLTIDDIKTARALYDGASIADTFKSVKASSANAKRIVVKNHFKAAIQKLVSAIPITFHACLKGDDGKPMPEGEAQEAEFKAWSNGVLLRSWDGADNFYSALPSYLKTCFIDGTVLHKAVKTPEGLAAFYRMDVIDTKTLGDGRTRRGVAGYEFTYTVSDSATYNTPGTGGVEIVERYTMGKMEFLGTPPEGEPQSAETGWPFIAVAHLNCEDQDETPMGMNVAQAMIGPFMEYIRAQTDRAYSNVMTGSPALVIINGGANAAPKVGPGVTIQLDNATPNVTPDAKYIGGGLSLTALENESEDHRRDVYAMAHVQADAKDEITTQASGSGKAQTILSGPGRQWVNNMFMPKLQAWLENILYMAAVIEGKPWTRDQISVSVGFGETPDKAQQIDEARFIAETIQAPREALRVLGREEEDIDRILKEANTRGMDETQREAARREIQKEMETTQPGEGQ